MSKIAEQTLRNSRLGVDNLQDQLARIGDPHATRIDATTVVSNSSGAFRSSVAYSSPVDMLSMKNRLENISITKKAEVISDTYSKYQSILGGTEATESILSRNLSDFIGIANTLRVERNMSTRQAFVDKAQSLAGSLNHIVDGIKSIRAETHSELIDTLRDANQELKALQFVNQQISIASEKNGSTYRLHNDRDRLISSLSEKFSLDISFGFKGQALVCLKGSNVELVSCYNYAQFSSKGVFSQEANNESSAKDLMISITRFDKDGVELTSDDLLGGNIDESRLIGGKVEALAILRDKTLKEALDTARFVRKTISDNINEIHNSSSPWPPVSKLISQKKIYGDDALEFTGNLSLFVLDEKGNQLSGNGGKLHKSVIDFDNFHTNNPSGKATIHEIVNELNNLLDSNISGPRNGLGHISVAGGDSSLPNTVTNSNREYLINDVKIAASKDIKNGLFEFDLDLTGNSYFGSSVEIVSVTGPNGPLVSVDIPDQDFILEKDFTGRTGQIVKVPINNAAGQNIDVKIRVTGENGVIDEGSLRFTIDGLSTNTLNKRFSGTVLAQPAGTGLDGFQHKISSHTGVARVRFVDDNGLDISPDDSHTQGRIIIDSNDTLYRFALQGSDFCNKLGLNNFFTIGADEITVREDILADPNKMSAGKINRSESQVTVVQNQGNKASATLNFIELAPGADFQNGDSISIEDINIVIGTDVNSAGTLQGTLDNIANFVASHPDLNKKLTINRNNNNLVIQAISGGTWGNNLRLGASVANLGNLAVDIDSANGPQTNINGNLANGTNISESINISDYSIGYESSECLADIFGLKDKIINFKGSNLMPESISTLGDFAASFVGVLSNQYNDAKHESEVRISMLDAVDKQFKADFGIDPEGTHFKLFEALNVYKMQSDVFARIMKVLTEVQETFTKLS